MYQNVGRIAFPHSVACWLSLSRVMLIEYLISRTHEHMRFATEIRSLWDNESKSNFIGHIHVFSRCYCRCSEMLVLIKTTLPVHHLLA